MNGQLEYRVCKIQYYHVFSLIVFVI